MNRRRFLKALCASPIAAPAMVHAMAESSMCAGAGSLGLVRLHKYAVNEPFIAADGQLVFGRMLDIEPATLNPASMSYSIASNLRSIDAIRDGGCELAIDGDSANLAALELEDIPPGHARTCVAEGAFRLGGAPASRITADVTGAPFADVHALSIDGRDLVDFEEQVDESFKACGIYLDYGPRVTDDSLADHSALVNQT